MKLKTARILSIITIAIQFLVLLITLFIILNQYSVKLHFLGEADALEIMTIPVSALCSGIIPLIIYGILICLLFMSENKKTRMSAVSLLLIGCMVQLSGGYLPVIERMLVGKYQGVYELVSLSTLEQAFSFMCTPFRTAAFALFCFVVGGYWGLKKEED